ncbi:inositol monophosphatase [bacterium]|nr:inositol monophosphatase [bacterium]
MTLNALSTALVAAGDLILSFADKKIEFSYKSSVKDIVTEADKAAEALLIDALTKIDDIAILAEESHADYLIGNDACWIIDPLDGTTNFYAGLDIYAVSVAHFNGKVVDYAGCYLPVSKDIYLATRGQGATKNGKQIKVNSQSDPEQAVVATGFADITQDHNKHTLSVFNDLIFKTRAIRRLGSAVTDILFVADGTFSFFYEAGLAPWDVAAAALIAEEAGATVSDFRGGSTFITDKTIIVSNRELYAFIKDTINRNFETSGGE